MDYIVERVEKLILDAGRLMLDTLVNHNTIYKKGPANYVTEVDYKVQSFVTGGLLDLMPGCNIITEEVRDNKFDFSKPTWILDPVDGTTNLIYRYGLSAISLGLFIDNHPVLAFVYNPFTNEIFHAQKGKGVFLNGMPVKVGPAVKLGDSLISFGTTPYNHSKAHQTFSILEEIFMKCKDIRRGGSAALDLAYIACGRHEGFFELQLQPWDYAAGILLVEEAGGRITDMSGEHLKLSEPCSVLATNGKIHEEMLEVLKKHI